MPSALTWISQVGWCSQLTEKQIDSGLRANLSLRCGWPIDWGSVRQLPVAEIGRLRPIHTRGLNRSRGRGGFDEVGRVS